MNIIRDEEAGGIFMIPLLVDWNIRRCNHRGCHNKPTTIVSQIDGQEGVILGLCEEHYDIANTSGKLEGTFDFGEI